MYPKHTASVLLLALGGAVLSTAPLEGQVQDDRDLIVTSLAMEFERPDSGSVEVPIGPSRPAIPGSAGFVRAGDRADGRLGSTRGPNAESLMVRRVPTTPTTLQGGELPTELPMFEQRQDRRGVPWIIAGSALIVGGAIVGDDVGTVLMAGGVGITAYGLFIYF